MRYDVTQRTARGRRPLAVVLIGVSGSGKSTIGKRLAASLGATFLEGDAYHTAANVALMRAGTPLRDVDRWPWLAKIGGAMAAHRRNGRAVVVACSALKRSYRERLEKTARQPLVFIHLALDPRRIETRLLTRRSHFMPASLLESQLRALEPLMSDENGTTVVETGTPSETVAAVRRWLFLPAPVRRTRKRAAPPPLRIARR